MENVRIKSHGIVHTSTWNPSVMGWRLGGGGGWGEGVGVYSWDARREGCERLCIPHPNSDFISAMQYSVILTAVRSALMAHGKSLVEPA